MEEVLYVLYSSVCLKYNKILLDELFILEIYCLHISKSVSFLL